MNGTDHCEKDMPKPPAFIDDKSYFYYLNYLEGLANHESAEYMHEVTDSMYNRMTFWMNATQFYRNDLRTGEAIGKDILADYAVIGDQKDAACAPEKRNVSFQRILLNAPQVHTRYFGDVNGIIISEFLLPSLGQFKFEFDPVFMSVPILPKIPDYYYLKVK